jgi:ribosomal protein S18 acetylase RimI-like enzyme
MNEAPSDIAHSPLIMLVLELTDVTRIRSFLGTDRAWADYALGDLDPAHFQFTEWYGAEENGELLAVVMVYHDLEPPIWFATGEARGIELILDRAVRLPQISLSIREEHLSIIAKYYQTEPVPMLKMALLPQDFRLAVPAIGNRAWRAEAERRPVPTEVVASKQMDAQRVRSSVANLIRLTLTHLPQLEALYALGGGDAFRQRSLALGVFYGILVDDHLISVAGTHIVSESERVAALGNVMTHPDYRGRGLATLATSAVCEELLKCGIELIGLSVSRSNEAAIRVYEKIGFKRHVPFYEGTAIRR